MIFRKHISILLTLFLLVSNLGFAFNVHYCDGKIASVTIRTISASPKAVDECCGIVEDDAGCCHDKVIKAEIKADQIIVKSVSFDAYFLPITYEWKPEVFVPKCNYKQENTFIYCCDAHTPPLYLLYSQYTFYA